MVRIKFKTNGSYRLDSRIKSMLPDSWSISVGLRTKAREYRATYNGEFEEIKEKLKKLGCTSIKINEG